MRYAHEKKARQASKTIEFVAQGISFVKHKGKRKGFRYRYESHTGNELLYVDYGRMLLTIAEKVEVLSPGNCCIVPARTKHSVQSDPDSPISFLNILYRGHCPRSLSRKILHLSPDERQIVAELKQEAENGSRHHKEILLLKLNLLLLLMDRNRRQPAVDLPFTGANRMRHSRRLALRALNWLESHLAQPLNPAAAARHVGVSPSHLRRIIRRETDKSLSRHLRHMRIEAAKRMLLESSENVDEISRHVGYMSVPHFCTIFKRETGKSPFQYACSLGGPQEPP